MRQVAALAGVSPKTVSRVINDEPGVSPALTARVQAAIDRLGYRPNRTASALRRADGRTGAIGLVLDDVSNPFSSAIYREIEDMALDQSILVFTGSSDEDPQRERSLVAEFVARRVDGLIMVPASHDHTYLLNDRQAGMAMVFVDRPPKFLDVDSVLTDNIDGVRKGIRHLLDRGHRRIAYLGDLETIATATWRYEGYTKELYSGGIAIDPSLVRLDLRGIESAEAAAAEILSSSQPTAVFAGQNLLTIGAYRALRKLGLHHKVALVGFDDFLLADLLEPGITVIAQDPTRIGRTAAEILLRRIEGDRSPSVHTLIPTHMIERGSGEIRP